MRYPKEQIIAVLVRRIPRHIEWPEPHKFKDNLKPFVLGVFAGPKFHFCFKDLFSRKKIKNRHVSIKPIESKEDLESIHMLFLAKSGEQDHTSVISWIEDKPILIVSYSPEITPAGIHINICKRHVDSSNSSLFKLQLNISRMKKSGFRASNYLLRGAAIEIISDKPENNNK